MIRLEPNLRWLYTELPMSQRAAAAAADGFRGVEVAFPYDVPAAAFRAELQRLGLTLVQILSPMDWDAGERGLAGLPGREAHFRASVEEALAYAAVCGRPLVHTAIGPNAPGTSRAEQLKTLRSNLRWAADRAGEQGVTLIVEPCCKARMPDFLMHSFAEGVEFVDALGCANVKLCYDTYHLAMEGDELLAQLDLGWPHIGHVQIGNVPGRHEPGEGELDLVAFLAALDAKGWTGWVGLEYTPRTNTRDSLHWARRAGLLPEASA